MFTCDGGFTESVLFVGQHLGEFRYIAPFLQRMRVIEVVLNVLGYFVTRKLQVPKRNEYKIRCILRDETNDHATFTLYLHGTKYMAKVTKSVRANIARELSTYTFFKGIIF